MKNKTEIAVLEKIAANVMKTCKRPEIRGVGHEARIRAPKNAAVFRVLAFDDFATVRGSRCGYTAKSFVLKVVERAAKKGIVWDWDGRIASEAAAKVCCAKYHAEIAARESNFFAAGGESAFQKWYAENPTACDNCQTDANKTSRARRNFTNLLMNSRVWSEKAHNERESVAGARAAIQSAKGGK